VIFVTVGTNEARFDRLLESLENLPARVELFVQRGPSSICPTGATCTDYLTFDEMVETMQRAEVVVMHAGVGSVLTALLNGIRPIVVPRLHRFGEAVDDHQLEFGRRAGTGGLVTLVEDTAGLAQAIERQRESPPPPPLPDERLLADLRSYLSEAVGRRNGRYSM
jgi:UDP-N-acetylglucosamine transferase subunit ALG13